MCRNVEHIYGIIFGVSFCFQVQQLFPHSSTVFRTFTRMSIQQGHFIWYTWYIDVLYLRGESKTSSCSRRSRLWLLVCFCWTLTVASWKIDTLVIKKVEWKTYHSTKFRALQLWKCMINQEKFKSAKQSQRMSFTHYQHTICRKYYKIPLKVLPLLKVGI
jgi:hypothetical protein